jgi:hypothetical protein
MSKVKYVGAALALVISNVAMASSYNCSVKEYVSEQSQQTADLIEPFAVEVNRAGDPVPAEFRQAGNLAWSVTRYDGLISAEARDLQGRSISISTTADGQSLGVKIISEKQILTCNPARSSARTLQVNPTTYGESMQIMDRSLVEKYRQLLRQQQNK